MGALVAPVLMVVVVAGPLWLLTTPKVQAMGNYPRHGISWLMAFSHAFTPSPPFDETTFFGVTVAVTGLLVLAGVVWTVLSAWDAFAAERVDAAEARGWDRALSSDAQDAPVDSAVTDGDAAQHPRPLLWPIASYLVFAFLTFVAYAPDSAFREFLLAPWYMDARRIMSTQGATIVPLASIGFAWCAQWVARRMQVDAPPAVARHAAVSRPMLRTMSVVLGVFLLVVTMGGALDARLWAVRYVYDADHLGKPGMATSGELAMLRRMPETLPEDAVVLGDPIAGAAYTEVIGQRTAVFPQLSMANEDAASQAVLSQHFNEIHTNPEVCEVVRRLKITHYYEDEDGWYYQTLRSRRSPGLYGVDTSTGFELVDQGGTAKLYRITACD